MQESVGLFWVTLDEHNRRSQEEVRLVTLTDTSLPQSRVSGAAMRRVHVIASVRSRNICERPRIVFKCGVQGVRKHDTAPVRVSAQPTDSRPQFRTLSLEKVHGVRRCQCPADKGHGAVGHHVWKVAAVKAWMQCESSMNNKSLACGLVATLYYSALITATTM
jgi:hypothetical protein